MNVSQKLNGTNDSKTCVIILSYNNVMWWADIWTYWKTWHLPLSEHSEWNHTNSLLESLKEKNKLYQVKAKFSNVSNICNGKIRNVSGESDVCETVHH